MITITLDVSGRQATHAPSNEKQFHFQKAYIFVISTSYVLTNAGTDTEVRGANWTTCCSSREALQKLITNLSHQPLHYFLEELAIVIDLLVIDLLVICSRTIY